MFLGTIKLLKVLRNLLVCMVVSDNVLLVCRRMVSFIREQMIWVFYSTGAYDLLQTVILVLINFSFSLFRDDFPITPTQKQSQYFFFQSYPLTFSHLSFLTIFQLLMPFCNWHGIRLDYVIWER